MDSKAVMGRRRVEAWFKDNPGWHFTEDAIAAMLADRDIPRFTSYADQYRTTQRLLYDLKTKGSLEWGGSKSTRKWRFKDGNAQQTAGRRDIPLAHGRTDGFGTSHR